MPAATRFPCGVGHNQQPARHFLQLRTESRFLLPTIDVRAGAGMLPLGLRHSP
jgi:hypothetical protein